PATPKIFDGREIELEAVLNILQESARVSILGGEGMGKTSLARAVLHHPDVVAKYESRLFVATHSATTGLSLQNSSGHISPVVQYFARGRSCLLILDNLETSWEPTTSRSNVEEFLSRLIDIPHLALIITMRGAERPRRVGWTHPFLSPLKPFSDDAARQTFMEIVHESPNPQDLDKLPRLTDNIPLAVDLITHLADYEGCSNVLARWETERTSLLSEGHDKQSSLDASIEVSLSSPRIASLPGAKDLLAVLSILPDGILDGDLVQSLVLIQNILACKSVFLGTALAYLDDNKRLKCLAPIREHIQQVHTPSASLIRPLRTYFYGILNISQIACGTAKMAGREREIAWNLGNIHHVLMHGLDA
ncbi:hypothetical protein B0H13DRAFT_1615081, partial [Mycena leptocephala]